MKVTRPVLRYPGGKYKLAKWIISHFSQHEFYVEPYCGAGSVLMRKPRTQGEIINDLDGDGVSRRNSGFRGLKNNETSVTATQEWSRYPDAIQTFINRLRNVLIEHRPALQLLKMYDRIETLFYVDPPYLMSTRSKDRNIYTHDMNEKDHEELATMLHAVKGMVVLSGYPSALYDKLYSGWRKISKSATAQNGKGRVECIWLSPNIQTTLF